MKIKNPLLAAVFIFCSSCSGLYDINKERLKPAISAQELTKGRQVRSITIEDHFETDKSLTVFVRIKDSSGISFLDTLTFTTTGDDLIIY